MLRAALFFALLTSVVACGAKARWEQAPTTRGSTSAHNYVGTSTETPGLKYLVTSYTIADLHPGARKAGLVKVLGPVRRCGIEAGFEGGRAHVLQVDQRALREPLVLEA